MLCLFIMPYIKRKMPKKKKIKLIKNENMTKYIAFKRMILVYYTHYDLFIIYKNVNLQSNTCIVKKIFFFN